MTEKKKKSEEILEEIKSMEVEEKWKLLENLHKEYFDKSHIAAETEGNAIND